MKIRPDGYPNRWPQPAASLTYFLNGAQVGRGNKLNIVGAGITAGPFTGDGTTYNITGGGGGGVTTLNTLSGAVTISAGANITLTPTGNDIEISASGGGTPSAPDTSIQFNDGGVFGGNADWTFNKTDLVVTLDSMDWFRPTAGSTVIGEGAGNLTMTGINNTAYGNLAGASITGGIENCIFGEKAGQDLTSGNSNCLFGVEAGRFLTGPGAPNSASYNTFLGSSSGFQTVLGEGNVGVGYAAAAGNVNGDYNTCIGTNAGPSSDVSASISIGAAAGSGGSNTCVIGSSVTGMDITDFYLGNGYAKAAPNGVTINATGNLSANGAGGDLILAGGRSAGNTLPASVWISTSLVGAAGSGRQVFLKNNVEFTGHGNIRAFGLHNNTSGQGDATQQDIRSGTFTPTRSAETNLDGNVTPTEAQWCRVGNVVTVSGRVTGVDPTIPGAASFELSIPVASNFAAVKDAAGTAFCGAISGQGAEIIGSIANNTVVIQWIAGDVTSQDWSYQYTYLVI